MVKVGLRTPNIKKSIKARTTGRVKRKLKSSVNPLYEKKGMGFINNPKKAVYNKAYSKTTIDPLKTVKSDFKKSSNKKQPIKQTVQPDYYVEKPKKHLYSKREWMPTFILMIFISIIFLVGAFPLGIFFTGLTVWIYVKKIKNNPYKTKDEIPQEYRKLTKAEKKAITTEAINDGEIMQAKLAQIERLEKDLTESVNPERFFGSYKTVEENLKTLRRLVEKHKEKPSMNYESMDSGINQMSESLPAMKEDFVTRYFTDNVKRANALKTEKGKENNLAKGKEKLLSYADQLDESTINLINTLYK